MTKYTQKQLRGMVKDGIAIDITYANEDERDDILDKEGYIRQIGYASGQYGCSGMLFKGNKTNTLYAIVGRTQAIYLF